MTWVAVEANLRLINAVTLVGAGTIAVIMKMWVLRAAARNFSLCSFASAVVLIAGVGWRFATTTCGAPCATTVSAWMMLVWFAVSWASLVRSNPFSNSEEVQAKFGWMTWVAVEANLRLRSAVTLVGAGTIAVIMKMWA